MRLGRVVAPRLGRGHVVEQAAQPGAPARGIADAHEHVGAHRVGVAADEVALEVLEVQLGGGPAPARQQARAIARVVAADAHFPPAISALNSRLELGVRQLRGARDQLAEALLHAQGLVDARDGLERPRGDEVAVVALVLERPARERARVPRAGEADGVGEDRVRVRAEHAGDVTQEGVDLAVDADREDQVVVVERLGDLRLPLVDEAADHVQPRHVQLGQARQRALLGHQGVQVRLERVRVAGQDREERREPVGLAVLVGVGLANEREELARALQL